MTAKRFLSFVSAKLQPLYILCNPHLLGGEAHALRDNREVLLHEASPHFFRSADKKYGKRKLYILLALPVFAGRNCQKINT